METNQLTVTATVNSDIETVWKLWTTPEHIKNWNFAIDSWHCPYAENDLRPGGTFKSTMASKDGAIRFDFEGTYSEIVAKERISYSMSDGRQCTVTFDETGNGITVTETFDAETTNPLEMQQQGWQAILNNFKSYVECY
ncbi:MAG TPA: SRPBCC family protein [Flavobacterium sp.]|jgi:uncharacterized protein YndB with AHSA1/START domain